MVKKCLGCGKVSDNNLYACTTCLRKVNDLRRQANPGSFWRKDWLFMRFKMIIVSLSIVILFSFFNAVKDFKLQQPSLFVLFSIVLFAAFDCAISFMVISGFLQHLSRAYLRQHQDPRFYAGRLARIIMLFKGMFPALVFAWVAFIAIVAIFIPIWYEWGREFAVSFSDQNFLYQMSVGFTFVGFLVGIIISYKYFDWMNKLEG